MWTLATNLPRLGDSATAVRAVATSLDQALTALGPAVSVLGGLDPDTLVAPDGSIDVAALETAADPLDNAKAGVTAAAQTLAEAPSRANGDPVIGRVDEAASQLASQLDQLDDTLDTAIEVTNLVPPLLGADGPKRYFVAILNPNEARGTGGFMGTYAIVEADRGKLTFEKVGSNSDLPNVPYTPPVLGADFIKRYSDGVRLVPNLNISPHFPDAGLLWLKSWQVKTGEKLDGAFSADIFALGDLVTATGETVTMPDGTSLTGAQLTEFALKGIYEKFPTGADVPARKAYQEAATRGALDVVTEATNRAALVSALGEALSQRRIQLWSADPAIAAADSSSRHRRHPRGAGRPQRRLRGHRLVCIEAGRLPRAVSDLRGRALPRTPARPGRVQGEGRPDQRHPGGRQGSDYVASHRPNVGPNGPINSSLVQLYLPNHAQVLEVAIDGKSSQYQIFREQGRVAVLLNLVLPPRDERTVTVEFSEPADDGPATAPEQPLALPQQTSIVDRACAATS